MANIGKTESVVRASATLAICVLVRTSAANAQQLDTSAALTGLRDAARACRSDDAKLWSRSLCGPIALVDRSSRMVIANDTVAGRPYVKLGDAYLTTLPGGVGLANTSFKWGGRPWALILLPLPADQFDRTTLLMHEVFHREQDSLGLAGQDPPNNQLDQMDGRIWFRLELRALAAAVESLDHSKRDARAHTLNALLFRARRRALYPLADSLEPPLEMQEGLAEYTGEHLAASATAGGMTRMAAHVRDFQKTGTFVRSFAYGTGPALGVLLDQFSPGWQSHVRTERDPATLLARALDFVAPRTLVRDADRRAAEYGFGEILREESARDAARRPMMADYGARLVDGNTITLRQQQLNRNFDPMSLVGFDVARTVYPTGSFSAEWGSLDVKEGGALVSNDFGTIVVGAPASLDPAANTVQGAGFSLSLKPGWRLQPVPSRPGSYVVQRATAAESR